MKLRKSWISGDESLPVSTQCQLIDVNRTSYYVKPKPLLPSDEDQLLMRLIDEESRSILFYGSRRMRQILIKKGYTVKRKRVQRLMRQLGLPGMAPGPNISKPHPEHKVYPYQLRGVTVTKPNQV